MNIQNCRASSDSPPPGPHSRFPLPFRGLSRVGLAAALASLIASLLAAGPVGARPGATAPATSASSQVQGRSGVIQFIGSGRIDEGPHRSTALTGLGPAASAITVDNPGPLRDPVPPFQESDEGPPRAGGAFRAPSLPIASANPELVLSRQGLNHYQHVYSGPGQVFGEPPDQGLCVGKHFVLESVNSVLRVFDGRARPLTDPIPLSQFYGYPPVYNQTTGEFSSITFDISCYYDPDTQRWFHVAVTTDLDPQTGAYAGPNRLDIAVSQGPNPLGMWNYWAIPTQNDGSEGTPNHHCAGVCFADYPHIGADRNGFYITTNEFGIPTFKFKGANLYAISKHQLAAGKEHPTIVQFETLSNPFGTSAFRLWPAVSPEGVYENRAGGSEYLVSNVECATCNGEHRLIVWALTNSSSLDGSKPTPALSGTVLGVRPYSVVGRLAEQRRGHIPLGECINDTSIVTPYGKGCWTYIFLNEPAHNEKESKLDPGSDIKQVYFSAGRLWTTQSTTVTVGGERKTGAAYYILHPSISGGGDLSASVEREGQFGVADNNVLHTAIAATSEGRGAISFTLSGEDYYPSAAYALIDLKHGLGKIRIASAGVGPVDGFTGYAAFGPPFQRFGDYGAAAVQGRNIWMATEYIGQTCTLRQYLVNTPASPLFTCGKTRTRSANWGTRISQIRLEGDGKH